MAIAATINNSGNILASHDGIAAIVTVPAAITISNTFGYDAVVYLKTKAVTGMTNKLEIEGNDEVRRSIAGQKPVALDVIDDITERMLPRQRTLICFDWWCRRGIFHHG